MTAPQESDGVYAYPVARSTIGTQELEAASDVLTSDRLTMADRVREFETAFAHWTGSPYAVMVNSGSSANLLMVEAMLRSPAVDRPWKAGDEILVPALSWPTTVWPLVQLGLRPVFTDIDHDTLAIDLDSAARVLGERTKGMLLIHVLGQPPDMTRVLDFAEANGLALLEDSCEALGSHDDQRHVGTMGIMGSFSFYFSHHLTTIEGGMVTTADAALRDDLRSMRSHGWNRDRDDRGLWNEDYDDIDPRFLFVTTGYNVRPTEIHAAIGLVQLGRLEEMLQQRRDLAQWVARHLDSIPWIRMIGSERLADDPAPARPWLTHSWMMLAFEVLEGAPVSPRAVADHFESAGVETRPIIAGNLVRHPAMAGVHYRSDDSLTVSDRMFDRGFMIGCHPGADEASMAALDAALSDLASL